MGRSSWIRDKNKSSQVLLSLVRLSLEIPQYLLSWLHPPHHHLSYSQDTYLQALPGTGWKLVPIPGSGQSGVAYPQIDHFSSSPFHGCRLCLLSPNLQSLLKPTALGHQGTANVPKTAISFSVPHLLGFVLSTVFLFRTSRTFLHGHHIRKMILLISPLVMQSSGPTVCQLN